jgi:hypothetical protein
VHSAYIYIPSDKPFMENTRNAKLVISNAQSAIPHSTSHNRQRQLATGDQLATGFGFGLWLWAIWATSQLAACAQQLAGAGAPCWPYQGPRADRPRPSSNKEQNAGRLHLCKRHRHRRDEVGRISWLGLVRLENPLGHGDFLSGLKLSGERDGGLSLARFLAVCPLGGHMCANTQVWQVLHVWA